MSDITEPVIFREEHQALIETRMSVPGYSHGDWSHADLEPLRSYVRAHYRKQQRGICAFCREPVSLYSAENCQVEHIAPKSLHLRFMFEPKNLCVICADCNFIKRNQEVTVEVPDTVAKSRGRQRYPRASKSFLIVHPHFDRYDEHIVVYRGFYFDRTDKGHFTIGACKLNRRLRQFGWDEEAIENPDLFAAAKLLLEAKDRPAKLAALQALREACLP